LNLNIFLVCINSTSERRQGKN